jgi:hypothetical protein
MRTNEEQKIPPFSDWVPRKEVKAFFNFGETKMSSFSRDHNVRTARVGKRLFYNREDLENLLES